MKLVCFILFFSFSLNLSFAQIWKKYSFSKELDEQYQQDPSEGFASSIAYDECLIGEYQKALVYYDLSSDQQRISKTKDSLLSTSKQIPATQELLKRTKNQQVVLFDYKYHTPAQKYYLTTLLPELKKQGFRLLGLDRLNTFYEDTLAKSSFFSTEDLWGYNEGEYYFRELIKQAQELGFTIFSLNKQNPEDGNSSEEQATTTLDFLSKHPQEKAIILANSTHLFKDTTQKTITSTLLSNGFNPFTVCLTDFLEHSKDSLEPSILKALKEPVYFVNDSTEFKGWNKASTYDMNIALPKWENTAVKKQQPNFVIPQKRFIEYPALVMLFDKKPFEDSNVVQYLLPLEIKEVHSAEEEVSFYVPKGEFILLFVYMDRAINHTLNVIKTQ
jgi:hypothetical protein